MLFLVRIVGDHYKVLQLNSSDYLAYRLPYCFKSLLQAKQVCRKLNSRRD